MAKKPQKDMKDWVDIHVMKKSAKSKDCGVYWIDDPFIEYVDNVLILQYGKME